MITRRTILKVLGAGAFANTMGRFGRLSALTSPTGSYRALVCVFLYGGNDSNNLIVPMDTTAFNNYTNIRKGLALASNVLLPVQAASGAPYGLHPKLVEVQTLFKNKNLAVVPNVGTLIQPLTRAQYNSSPTLAPNNLFSHSDQQAEWQSSVAQGQATTGWGGRLADQMASFNGATSFPTLVSVSGNALFSAGQHTKAGTFIPGAALGLQGYNGSAAANARLAALTDLLNLNSGATLVQQANSTLKQGMDNAADLQRAMNGAGALRTTFPSTNFGSQMAEVAKIIQVRQQLGVTRQIFFASLGGFDTHTNQLNDQDNLLTQLSQGLGAFYQATQELGVAENVTTFTESDFSRTLQPNTNGGTDHAWGSHHLVMGGSVKGGDLYNAFPTLSLGGPDDAGTEGRWIPTVSTDQYGATLSRWFGLDSSLLSSVFPNIANFKNTDLKFFA